MTQPSAIPRRGGFPLRLSLAGAVLVGYCLLVLFPVVKRKFGIFDHGVWFLDSYAVLASSDAVQAGADPFLPNPFDVYERPHSYSGWWFLLGEIGLTRDDNFLVGGLWVTAFGFAAFALLRPVRLREALIGAGVLLAPPVVLAVNRANNDLVVFAVLAAGLLAIRGTQPWRLALLGLSFALATGLKFYPIVAGISLLLVRPPKRMWSVVIPVWLAVALVLASVWGDFQRAVFPAPTEAFTFGAPVIFRDLGWTGPPALLMGVGLLGVGAWVCIRHGWFLRLDPALDDRDRFAFAVGAALLVGCFIAGISHSYRLIYVIFLLPCLWRQVAVPAARWLGILLFAALWLDGIYCLVANLLVGPMPAAELVRWQLMWRWLTQPVIWAGMAMLASSLLAMALAAWRARGQEEKPVS